MSGEISISKALSVTRIPIVTHILPSELKAVYIIPFSDTQIGDPGFYEGLFIQYREWVLERDNAFVVLPGDVFENPVRGNKASDYWEMHLTPEKAMRKAKVLFKPLAEAGRILGAVDGNHEYRSYVMTGISPMITLLESLGLPTEGDESIYDPEGIVIRIGFGENKASHKQNFIYNIYMSHGWGGARKTGAHVNKTEEMAAVVTNADVYILGHEHTLYDSRWDSASIPQSLQAKVCKPVRQVFVGGGTFCRYSKFQKRVQRRLPNLGSPRIRLEGISGHKGHKDVHVSI